MNIKHLNDIKIHNIASRLEKMYYIKENKLLFLLFSKY